LYHIYNSIAHICSGTVIPYYDQFAYTKNLIFSRPRQCKHHPTIISNWKRVKSGSSFFHSYLITALFCVPNLQLRNVFYHLRDLHST